MKNTNKPKYYTPSNIMSSMRLVLALPMVILLSHGYNLASVGVGVLAMITDLLDGFLARRNNEVTDIGKIIDPFADKVFVGATVLTLLLLDKLALWYVIVIIGRDLLILLAGLYAKNKIKIVIMSNYIGKATVLTIAMTILSAVMDWKDILYWAMIVSVAGVAISSVSYLIGFIKALKNNKID